MDQMLQQLAQLGAVGIVCGLLVYQNREHQNQMAHRLGTLEAAIIDLVRNNTAAMRNLASALAQRPCLHEHSALADRDEDTDQ